MLALTLLLRGSLDASPAQWVRTKTTLECPGAGAARLNKVKIHKDKYHVSPVNLERWVGEFVSTALQVFRVSLAPQACV